MRAMEIISDTTGKKNFLKYVGIIYVIGIIILIVFKGQNVSNGMSVLLAVIITIIFLLPYFFIPTIVVLYFNPIKVYDTHIQFLAGFLDNRYKRSFWDRNVKIPWSDIFSVSFSNKEIFKNIPYLNELPNNINIFNYNMEKIADIKISIFSSKSYLEKIRVILITKGIKVGDEQLHNFSDATNNAEPSTTSVNREREMVNDNVPYNTVGNLSENHAICQTNISHQVSASQRRKIVNSSSTNLEINPSAHQNKNKGRRLEL